MTHHIRKGYVSTYRDVRSGRDVDGAEVTSNIDSAVPQSLRFQILWRPQLQLATARDDGRRPSQPPMPRKQAPEDMRALNLEHFLVTWRNHLLETPDRLAEDVGGNRTRPSDE
jgi:hypothetical protein